MNRRGNIVIAVLLVLLLSFAGLALLTHSLLHSKIISARRGKWLIAGRLESSLMLQLHRYRQLLEGSDMNRFADPENDFFNTVNFPDLSAGDCQVKSLFSRRSLSADSGFFKTRIFNCLTARSSGSLWTYRGQAAVDLLRGDVPLSEIALLLTAETSGEQSAYLAARGVEWSGSLLPPAGKPQLAGDFRELLAEAMRLPAPLPDWRQIREKFKLEISDAPVPPGIYLTLAAGVVETVFVEGDLQLLEFRAADGLQAISFRQHGPAAELSYRPDKESLSWSGPEAVSGFRFAEKIIVHGNIWAIAQSGKAAFADGSRIQVLASGQMRVNTGLVGETLALQRTKFANLLLMTGGRDFFTGDGINGDIVLAADDGSTVEAHLLAAGKVVHGEGLLELSGSLIAGDIQNSGRLRIDAVAGRFDFAEHMKAKNFQCLQNFQVHFIMEGGNE